MGELKEYMDIRKPPHFTTREKSGGPGADLRNSVKGLYKLKIFYMAMSRPASLGQIVVTLRVLKVETAEIEISKLQEAFISVGDRSGTKGGGHVQ
jgi:hypothetical protein